MIVADAISFALLGRVLKFIPVGIADAMRSGLGIVFIAPIGLTVFGQTLDLPALPGMALVVGHILAGVPVIHLFSATATH